MFDNLVESKPQRKGIKQQIGSTMLSLVLHTGLIWGAVIATLKSGLVSQDQQLDTNMVFLQEEKPKPQEQQPELKLEAPPQSFVSLSAPISIPTNIPPINLNEKFDPRDFSGVGVERKVDISSDVKIDPGKAFVEAAVDEKPERLSSPPLDYPDLLKQAGIEGNVMLEFIIDTTGHPESGSLKTVSSTNKAFEPGAREMILKSLFRPGRVRGQAVRVVVQQPVAFNLRH